MRISSGDGARVGVVRCMEGVYNVNSKVLELHECSMSTKGLKHAWVNETKTHACRG